MWKSDAKSPSSRILIRTFQGSHHQSGLNPLKFNLHGSLTPRSESVSRYCRMNRGRNGAWIPSADCRFASRDTSDCCWRESPPCRSLPNAANCRRCCPSASATSLSIRPIIFMVQSLRKQIHEIVWELGPGQDTQRQ